jgi:hypothetical protein
VLQPFRFLFHAGTWPVFLCVLTGLLTGHSTLACVRASLLTADVKWRQCCDLYRRARWSRAAFLRATTSFVLHTHYPQGLPARLWWVADTTTSDKPAARKVFGIRRFWRGCRRPGQAPTHRGHGWVLLAHLHQRPDHSWQALLVGALLGLQLRRASPGRLTAALVAQLGLPARATHVIVSDRGLSSRELVRALRARGCHSVTRLRRNTVVYAAASRPEPPRPGRPRKYGAKYRVDALDRTLLTPTAVTVWADQRRAGGHRLARRLLAQGPTRAGRDRPRRDGAPCPLVPASDRAHADHGGDRRRLSRAPCHRAGDPRGQRPRPRPLPWPHRPRGAAMVKAAPPAGCGAGRCRSAWPTACWRWWPSARCPWTCRRWAGRGTRARTPSGKCAVGCWPPWRALAFSCPQGGWAKTHRKSAAPHSLYAPPSAYR